MKPNSRSLIVILLIALLMVTIITTSSAAPEVIAISIDQGNGGDGGNVTSDTREEAIEAGHRPCQRCNP